MKSLLRLTRMSIALGLLTLAGLFFSALALTDIYHQAEPDLNLEWSVVRMSYLLTLMFTAISLITIYKISKRTA